MIEDLARPARHQHLSLEVVVENIVAVEAIVVSTLVVALWFRRFGGRGSLCGFASGGFFIEEVGETHCV